MSLNKFKEAYIFYSFNSLLLNNVIYSFPSLSPSSQLQFHVKFLHGLGLFSKTPPIGLVQGVRFISDGMQRDKTLQAEILFLRLLLRTAVGGSPAKPLLARGGHKAYRSSAWGAQGGSCKMELGGL